MQQNSLFYIDAAISAAFPELKVGVVVIRGVSVRPGHPDLESLKNTVIEDIREQLEGKSVADLPPVQAYRRIYRKFGVDPDSHRPGIEALLDRALDPAKGLCHINTVVDACNLTSVEFFLPMRAYDLQLLTPPVSLRYARAGEVFRGIGQAKPEPLTTNEIVYADQCTVLCQDLNYRSADATKVTAETRDLIVFVDGCDQTSAADLMEALEAVAMRIVTFSGGTVESLDICAT